MPQPNQPTRTYDRSWVSQRLLNRAPSWSRARLFPYSVAGQIINPIAREIQKTYQDLIETRYNQFLPTANINLMSKVYEALLPDNLSFTSVYDAAGRQTYDVPTVYATINGSETQIYIAENNNIETFWYDCLPTRIEYGEESYTYLDVIDNVLISDLSSTTPSAVTLEGHLYLTISGNSNWEEQTQNNIYFSKIWLEGTLRKGTDNFKEVIPIRYNGTFKTNNQWESIDTITSSYLSNNARITISPLPFAASEELDRRNIYVPIDAKERMRFIRLSNSRSWGSSLVAESFTTDDMDIVRLGYEEKETIYELELLDTDDNNVNINAIAIQPNTDFVFAIDNTNFYVYDTKLPYPDISLLNNETADAKIQLLSDRWVYARGETATLSTRLNSFANPPVYIRWKITLPNGTEYYVGQDGSYWATSVDAWIRNREYDEGSWRNVSIDFTLDTAGTYSIELEARYYDEDSKVTTTQISTCLFFVPAITPETTIALPVSLRSCTDLSFDSDGKLWFYDGTDILLANVYYDYFIADYETNKLYLREQYSQVRIVP